MGKSTSTNPAGVFPPNGTGRTKAGSPNSMWSQRQGNAGATNSTFVLILLSAEFYEGNIKTEVEEGDRQGHALDWKPGRWGLAEGRLPHKPQ